MSEMVDPGYMQELGPLKVLLDDARVDEIMVVGPKMIYVESGGKVVLTNLSFRDEDHLRKVIDIIVAAVGRRVDAKQPLVDARLLDGSRVNAVVEPIALDGSLLTIRKFAKEKLRITDLVKFGSLNEGAASFLQACVLARANILISGGTGSGKTTLLNICSGFIPGDERIVTVEDAAELQLQQEHVCRMESRPPDAHGDGRIGIRELVINALRMRPDRIVVGEVRGGEALDMLQAMNTGHDGSMTTVHANTPRDSLARLETQVLMGGIELPAKAIRQQIASAINVVVQLNRLRDGSRKVTAISEVVGMEGDTITMQDIFILKMLGTDDNGKLKAELELTGVRPQILDRLFDMGLPLPPEISRLFPDRRGNQVAAVKLPTPPPGGLLRRTAG